MPPLNARHSVHSFTGTLKITFIDLTTGDAFWAVTLPGASELHGTSIGIDEIAERALIAAVSR